MARNNITPIGDGSVGIDSSIKDTAAQQIQEAVSQQNLKWQLGQNSSVKGVFNATLQMVSNWSDPDKMNLISAYGDPTGISRNPTSEELNQALATILVSRLKKEDLKKIIGDAEVKNKQLLKDIRVTSAKTSARNRSYFRMSNINSSGLVDDTNIRTSKKLLQNIKRKGFTFSADKWVKKDALPKLRKSLFKLLKAFDRRKIAEIAVGMGIDFYDGESIKDVSTKIINKINLYVAVLLGKAKGVSHLGLDPNEMETIEKVLSMTEFAWVVGNTTLTPADIGKKRRLAMEAKNRMIAEREKLKDRLKIDKKIKRNKHGRPKLKIFNKIARQSREAGEVAKQIPELNELLSDPEKVKDLARGFGIPFDETTDLKDIANQVLTYIGADFTSYQRAMKKAKTSRFKSVRKRAEEEAKNIRANSTMGALLKQKRDLQQEYSDKIPVITLNSSGKIASEAILKAVPVVIAGYTGGGGRLQSSEEAAAARDEDKINLNATTTSYFDAISNKISSNKDIAKGKDVDKHLNIKGVNSFANSVKDISVAPKVSASRGRELGQGQPSTIKQVNSNNSTNVDINQLDPLKYVDYFYTKLQELYKQYNALPNSNPATPPATPTPAKQKRVLTQDQKDAMQEGRRKKKEAIEAAKKNPQNGLQLSVIKSKLSYIGRKYFLSGSIPIEAASKVIPVIDLNKTHDYSDTLKDIDRGIAQIATNTSSLVTSMPTLQSAMGTNTAAMSSVTTVVGQMLQSAGDITNAQLKNARGGIEKAAIGKNTKSKNGVSQILTGDHPRSKYNPELVSVDWQNKKLKVNPLNTSKPVTKKERLDNSGFSYSRQLSGSEARGVDLGVNINRGVVYYKKSLQDVRDDGSGTALKVYTVNSSLSEKIKVGDKEVSIGELLYGIYSSLPVMITQLTSGNQLLTAISTNTAQTASRILQLGNKSNDSKFSFPSNLDTVLGG